MSKKKSDKIILQSKLLQKFYEIVIRSKDCKDGKMEVKWFLEIVTSVGNFSWDFIGVE